MKAQQGIATVLLLKVGATLALLVLAIALYHLHAEGLREEGRQEIRADHAARALATEQEYRRLEAKRVSEQVAIQQRKNHEIAALDRRLADALGRLRQRPERPAGGVAAADPAAGKACTGAELYRPDAEFLVREAARAQRVLTERDACHSAYDALTVKP